MMSIFGKRYARYVDVPYTPGNPEYLKLRVLSSAPWFCHIVSVDVLLVVVQLLRPTTSDGSKMDHETYVENHWFDAIMLRKGLGTTEHTVCDYREWCS